MELSGLGALSGIGTAVSDRKTIAGNFDTFLQLLTTQLKNQSPLDPLDTNEFTNQLVQFSSVEQAIKTNEQLELLTRLSAANMATAAVSYIGKTITADGSTSELKNGEATWIYKVENDAPKSTLIVRDETGKTVSAQEASLQAGTHTLSWDGKDGFGNPLPDGKYSLEIVAKDKNGSAVRVTTSVAGRVDSIDLSGDEPILQVGNKNIKLSTVKYIGQG